MLGQFMVDYIMLASGIVQELEFNICNCNYILASWDDTKLATVTRGIIYVLINLTRKPRNL